jgi:3-oxoacyl-[acyl-carrier protein] reductase
MNQLLLNQKAIITGGTRGIGLSISKLFLQHGAKVFLFGSTQAHGEAALKSLKEERQGGQVEFFSVDVSKTGETEAVIQKLLQAEGGIDILVNNAGITRDQLLMKMSEEDWDRVMEVNLKSCFNTSRALARSMLKQRHGKIINISSVVGIRGNAGQCNYAASKGAIIAMTKSMASEFASRQILVNCIAPGFIETSMTDSLTETQQDSILSKIPLGRMGSPLEVANAALFLASEMSSYITGHVLVVDGGMAT